MTIPPGKNPDPAEKEVYGDYSVDDEDQPAAEDFMLDETVTDEGERGYSPPEKYSAGQGYGNTPWEEEHRETIDQRLGQEVPEPDPYEEAENADVTADVAGTGTPPDAPGDDQVGDRRAGRLVDTDEGVRTDTEADLVAQDVGVDGAAASAEEAAVHVVEDPDLA